MTEDEQYALILRAQQGDDDARNQVAEAHLGLIGHIAKWYRGRGVEYEDLCQEGIFGLLQAIMYFHNGRGTFSAYASKCIRVSLRVAIIQKGELIPKPQSALDCRARIKKGIRPKRFRRYRREPHVSQHAKQPQLQAEVALGYTTDSVSSLNVALRSRSDEKSVQRYSTLRDEHVLRPEQELIAREQIAEMASNVGKAYGIVRRLKLGDCCVDIFLHRTGLGEGEEHESLQAIARKHNKPFYQQVQQLETRMWDRLKNHKVCFDRDSAASYVEAFHMLRESVTYS